MTAFSVESVGCVHVVGGGKQGRHGLGAACAHTRSVRMVTRVPVSDAAAQSASLGVDVVLADGAIAVLNGRLGASRAAAIGLWIQRVSATHARFRRRNRKCSSNRY